MEHVISNTSGDDSGRKQHACVTPRDADATRGEAGGETAIKGSMLSSLASRWNFQLPQQVVRLAHNTRLIRPRFRELLCDLPRIVETDGQALVRDVSNGIA